MTYSRYHNRSLFINDDREYVESLLKDRGIKNLDQYGTPVFNYPTEGEMIEDLDISIERWGATSKLYNLAHDYYGDASLWWLIAWFNRKPTEGHYSIGDIIYIPAPADAAIALFEANQ